MNVHAIRTGTVHVRERQRRGEGRGALRPLLTMADRRWAEPLPIHMFAVEHPEGLIVIDTGETARAAQPGYWPRWHPYYRFAVRVDVAPEQEAGPALRAAGLDPDDVRWVLMTHMHTDHAGGLEHFPRAEVLVTGAELRATEGLRGRIGGYLRNRWPTWLAPRAVDLPARPFGPFPRSQAVTQAGDVVLVATPGHTPGHMSVALDEGERLILFAGDASYNEQLMLEGVVDGVAPDPAVAADTLGRLQRLVRERPTVFLPAHDAASADRLDSRTPTKA